ncbi:MAG: hypothetical protein ABL977_02735 [Candidatus Eisenbacteria bacterium]
MTEQQRFLDEMAATQAHNLEWFRQVVGPSWQSVSSVIELCDVLLASWEKSGIRMREERVRALTALIHGAKRAGSTAILSLGRGQWLEAQPQFRRYVECFGFARIAWAHEDDAMTWLNGVRDAEAYDAYRNRFGKLLPKALKALDRSVYDAYDRFSKATHSSFLSMQHTMSIGNDEHTWELRVHYFDVMGVQDTAAYVSSFVEAVRTLLICQESFALRTFGTPEWKPSLEHWAAAGQPVIKEWLDLEGTLLHRVGLREPPVAPGN